MTEGSQVRWIGCSQIPDCGRVWRKAHGASVGGCRRGPRRLRVLQRLCHRYSSLSENLSRWLTLREPFDAAARSEVLARSVAAMVPADRPVRIVDLGTGSGSNIRYLAPFLPL